MRQTERFALYPYDKKRPWAPKLEGHKQRKRHRRTKDELLILERRTAAISQEILHPTQLSEVQPQTRGSRSEE